jgi:hypothetical protein
LILREPGCGNNRVGCLTGLREILDYASDDCLGGHRREQFCVQMCPQRFQNQLKKIVDRTTAFNVDRLALAHDRLTVPANRVSAPAKNCAQSDCKNLIGRIVRAAWLPRLLNSYDRGGRGLRDIQLCRFILKDARRWPISGAPSGF